MFLLLTQILLWLLIATIFYYLLVRFIPRKYLTWLGGLLLFIFIVLAFVDPTQSRLVSQAWSILSFPLTPLGLSIVLLMSALRQGVKKVTGNQVMAAALVLTLSSVPILAYNLAQRAEGEAIQVEQQRPPAATPATAQVGAIVVLARGTTEASLPLNEVGARLVYAGQLYQQQSASGSPPLVIVSTTIDPNEITRQLGRAGVPSGQVVVASRGTELRSIAQEVDQILRRSPGVINRRIILVSPALTSRRAILTFANLGITAVPRSTDFFTTLARTAGQLQVENFIPNVQALTVTTRVVEEFLTSIYYFLRGWLVPVLA